LAGDIAEERPHRRRGDGAGAAVVVRGEGDQVAAIGADRVARLVRVLQVGEEIVDMPGKRVARQGADSRPWGLRAGSCLITGKRRATAAGYSL
jgi:hypothetical protein